jgi:hypothetical protein
MYLVLRDQLHIVTWIHLPNHTSQFTLVTTVLQVGELFGLTYLTLYLARPSELL